MKTMYAYNWWALTLDWQKREEFRNLMNGGKALNEKQIVSLYNLYGNASAKSVTN